MQIEICIENLHEAELANKYKCDRIEVCSALDLGGLTPPYSLIQACAKIQGIDSHILIRSRAGNFMYKTEELILMKEDIKIAAEAGAKGVVFGCLNSDNVIDISSCELLVRIAKDYHLETTFHRAIDFTSDYISSLKTIIDLGFDRVLTSGQEEKALDGIENIKTISNLFSGQIELMAGSGINEENINHFIEIDLNAVHFSLRKKNNLLAKYAMGLESTPDESKLKTIIQKIRK